MTSARFEVVRARNGEWFGRYIAANGKEVWRTSETYQRKRGAHGAVMSLAYYFRAAPRDVRVIDERAGADGRAT